MDMLNPDSESCRPLTCFYLFPRDISMVQNHSTHLEQCLKVVFHLLNFNRCIATVSNKMEYFSYKHYTGKPEG